MDKDSTGPIAKPQPNNQIQPSYGAFAPGLQVVHQLYRQALDILTLRPMEAAALLQTAAKALSDVAKLRGVQVNHNVVRETPSEPRKPLTAAEQVAAWKKAIAGD